MDFLVSAFEMVVLCGLADCYRGFTLAFSRHGGPFIGDMSNFGMMNVSVSHAMAFCGLADRPR